MDPNDEYHRESERKFLQELYRDERSLVLGLRRIVLVIFFVPVLAFVLYQVFADASRSSKLTFGAVSLLLVISIIRDSVGRRTIRIPTMVLWAAWFALVLYAWL